MSSQRAHPQPLEMASAAPQLWAWESFRAQDSLWVSLMDIEQDGSPSWSAGQTSPLMSGPRHSPGTWPSGSRAADGLGVSSTAALLCPPPPAQRSGQGLLGPLLPLGVVRSQAGPECGREDCGSQSPPTTPTLLRSLGVATWVPHHGGARTLNLSSLSNEI